MRTTSWREPIVNLPDPNSGVDLGPGISYNEYYYDFNPLYEVDGSYSFYEKIFYKNGEIQKVEIVKK